MTREILKYHNVSLTQNEDGEYWLHQTGHHSYPLKPDSRTYVAIKILDNLCVSKDRRYALANSVIYDLEERLEKIESSKLYKFLHMLGLL